MPQLTVQQKYKFTMMAAAFLTDLRRRVEQQGSLQPAEATKEVAEIMAEALAAFGRQRA